MVVGARKEAAEDAAGAKAKRTSSKEELEGARRSRSARLGKSVTARAQSRTSLLWRVVTLSPRSEKLGSDRNTDSQRSGHAALLSFRERDRAGNRTRRGQCTVKWGNLKNEEPKARMEPRADEREPRAEGSTAFTPQAVSSGLRAKPGGSGVERRFVARFKVSGSNLAGNW